jgi:hypothetical protein
MASITAGARGHQAFRVSCRVRAGWRAEVRAGRSRGMRSRGSGRPGFRVLLPGGFVPGGPGIHRISDESASQPQNRNHGVGASVECTRIPGASAEVAARRGLIDLYFFGGKK